MKQARFQNTLRKGKKKKALHRGTFEVVKIFSFQCLAPERERESERTWACVSLCVVRATDVAVRVHLRAETPGRASPAHGDTCVCRARAGELARRCPCTHVALHMPVALLTPAVSGWRASVAP